MVAQVRALLLGANLGSCKRIVKSASPPSRRAPFSAIVRPLRDPSYSSRPSLGGSMESRLFRRFLTTLAALFLLACTAFAASSEKVLFSFGEDRGEYPDTDLIFDKAGNLY